MQNNKIDLVGKLIRLAPTSPFTYVVNSVDRFGDMLVTSTSNPRCVVLVDSVTKFYPVPEESTIS